ncbi:hypothetical protein D049_3499B, partial [Vibrio parahaemolyticus VPTS-2010]
NSTNDNCQLL